MTSFLIKTSCLSKLEKDSCGFGFKCISFYLALPKEDMTLSLMSLAYVKGQWSVIHILLHHHLLSLRLLPLPLSSFLSFKVILILLEPSAAPQNVQGRPTSPTEILVKWDEVPEDKQNGEILQYTILYRKTEGGEQKISQVNSRSVKLTGLAKYTVYSISVVATTIKGDGPASSTITVRTDEDSKYLQGHHRSIKDILLNTVWVLWIVQ